MSIDPKIIEVLQKKIKSEGQDEDIFKILKNWLNELDEGKENLAHDEKIKAILDKLNV